MLPLELQYLVDHVCVCVCVCVCMCVGMCVCVDTVFEVRISRSMLPRWLWEGKEPWTSSISHLLACLACDGY
jgi:hypothetical protein